MLASCGGGSGAERLRAHDAWIRPTAPGVESAAVYLTVENGTTTADVLLGGDAAPCMVLSVHVTTTDASGVSEMSDAGEHVSEVAPGGALRLQPEGLHLMCYGLAVPLVEGQEVPITLHFQHGGDVHVVALVTDR
jgi:hypothetical protein